MIRVRSLILACGLAVPAFVPAHAGVEKPIDLEAVPAKVMEIAKELAKGNLAEVKFVSSNTETEDDGSVVYEIQGVLPDGRKVEFDIFAKGNVEEIEIEFKLEDVPGAVLKAIEKKLPGFEPEFIEASHSRSMKVTGYEFVGKMGDADMDIEVSADGRRIVVSDQ